MKHYLLALSLLAGLTSCGNKADDPAAPTDSLLGHWQADTQRDVATDATGKVSSDVTTQQVLLLDVTPTTMTFTGKTKGGTSTTEVDTYTRNGEVLTFSGKAYNANESNYVRNLTGTSFTLQIDGKRSTSAATYQTILPFHR